MIAQITKWPILYRIVAIPQDLFKLAQVLTEDVEEFARRFEPEPPPPEIDDAREVQELFAELERMEAEYALTRQKAEAPASAETAES
jgi:hypothetical protein